MWRQRVRWSRGHRLVFLARFKDLMKSLFSKNSKHKISVWDITMNIMPFCLIVLGINLFHLIFLLFTPLFSDISLQFVFLNNPGYGFMGVVVAKLFGV